jgi:site-specific DNA-methyltransferase (adenine-specific)
MEFMRELPDQFFDLCIWDPPYGIDAAKMGMGGTASNRRTARRLYKEHTERKKASFSAGAGKLKDRLLNQSSLDWDSKIPDDAVFDEIFRVSKNQIIWGGNYYDLPPCRCFVAWDKVQPWENFSQVELAWTSFDMPSKLFRFDNRSWTKHHPTGKPVKLYSYLLKTFAKSGDRILDPMTGGGTSRVAAYKMGFDYWGCEINKDYFDKAQDFFSRECLGEVRTKDGKIIKQLNLFEE